MFFKKESEAPKLDVVKMRGGTLYGVQAALEGRDARQALPELSTHYHKIIGIKPGQYLPLYVVRRREAGKDWLFIGSPRNHSGLEALPMPESAYARVAVHPRRSLFWTKAIEDAHAYFLNEWLPGSGYSFNGLEFEYHSEKSVAKRPELDLFFALEGKEE